FLSSILDFPSQEIEEVEERSVLAPIQPLITSGINSQISTQILRIMATPASQLFVSPGGTGNIFLRVKNRGAAFSTFFFSVGANIGQNFVAVQPRQVELGIAQEIEIIVTVQVPINIYPGQNVLLTLYAIRGIDNAQTARQILIQTRNEPYDITQPYARLLTATRCSEHTFGSCATHSWAAVLEIVDTESGLRAIETRPEIAFNGEDFPIGRNSSVLVTFETTCCQRSIEIFTYDLKGNQRYDIIDQYKIALSPDNLEDLRENVNVYVAPPPYVPPPTGPGGGTSPGDTSSVQLTINASPASQLFISPGSTGEVILNVRNNGAYSVFQFRAVSVTQPQALIQVETVEAAIEKDREIPVRLRLTLPVSVYPGQTLVISFIAGKRYTNDYTSQSIMIQTREKPDDRTPPIVRVLTVGTCNAVPETGNCATGSWPFAVEVRDDEIGIRSLVTSPIIPFGREEFVIGSNSSNIRVFRPSCCISRVEVRAEDSNGNSNFVIVDRFQPLCKEKKKDERYFEFNSDYRATHFQKHNSKELKNGNEVKIKPKKVQKTTLFDILKWLWPGGLQKTPEESVVGENNLEQQDASLSQFNAAKSIELVFSGASCFSTSES
ncbi:hypothetical protein QYM36_012052, partial [Artemia franciscana]